METARSDSKPKTQVPRSSSSNSDSQSQSPYRFQSPHRSDYGDPLESPPYASPSASPEKSLSPLQNSMAVVAVDTHKSTQYSPAPSSFPPDNLSAPPELVLNKVARERVADGVVRKVGTASVARRSRKEEKMRTGELGFRVSEIIMCLISFAVMAADKIQGWSGDSFYRYIEYRYCLAVNVIGFVYAGFQAYDLSYQLATGKHVIRHHLRQHFNFFMDQISFPEDHYCECSFVSPQLTWWVHLNSLCA
ncbi:CASP-like protein 4A2 isoform X2 [Populus trichocarpa]|uniref:CASP-like protein 4A2 isoform X2 n=1 Tax=Populus trichocarpa TaxID=3694 RepID=UPI000D187D10|nr:CASP-like protein 4A2 isoform X2 [Populus trichocarpa]|eukprot:XP_024437576.1 CASP-like protein 4A2 isoform X2 [Populus trichocarpa]